MKDVRWREYLLAVVLSYVLILPVYVAVFFALRDIMDFSRGAASSWAAISVGVTCVAGGLFFASKHEGPEDAIEHGWAWLLVVGAITAVALIPYAAGVISQEMAVYVLSYHLMVAWVFLVAMLAVFINNRGFMGKRAKWNTRSEGRMADAQREAEIETMTMSSRRL